MRHHSTEVPVSARWHYHDVMLQVQATLAHSAKRYTVPMHGGESLDHAMFKVSIAAHLLAWGYHWKQVHWEEIPSRGPKRYRPDIYAEGNDSLPSFWFECVGTEQKKLKAVVAAYPGFRVVHVIDCDWFTRVWTGETIYVVDDKITRLHQIKDWRERKRLVLQERESFLPLGVECWAIRGRGNSPRIIYAVRRESDGRFTYLDSGEGWSLSSFRYISTCREDFQPLIPRVVGREKWRGHSHP
jgi:hypothetical protein